MPSENNYRAILHVKLLPMKPVSTLFFNRDALVVAKALLGKVIRHKVGDVWLSARIIETEAYFRDEKGSHASLGLTPSRKALFMPAGTIYMYYSRGRDSLNISCQGEGNAVLIKSAFPHFDMMSPESTLPIMQGHYPLQKNGQQRALERLCAGQTLLCQALAIKLPEWNTQQFDHNRFFIDDLGFEPEHIQTQRLGIPVGRDEHLPYRFIDKDYLKYCTKKPAMV